MIAEVIAQANERSVRELKRPLAQVLTSGPEADGVVDDFQINNNMFDESELWILGQGGRRGAKKRRRVLACAAQVTRRAPGASTVDEDLLRSPTVMKRYTAATCASILAKPEDSAGLLPGAEAAPKARYFGSLTATDSHSVNKLVSKWVATKQDGLGQNRFHAASYCAQQKTGNAVQ